LERLNTSLLGFGVYPEHAIVDTLIGNHMDKETETFGLDPESLSQIWQIGSDTDDPDQTAECDDRRAELLRDRLAERLPFSTSDDTIHWEAPDEFRSVLFSLANEPVGRILLSPDVGVELLERVKQHGKALSRRATTETEHQTANVIYYAAIAKALALCRKKISSFSLTSLADSFVLLSESNWLTRELTELFEEAHKVCIRRRETHGKGRKPSD